MYNYFKFKDELDRTIGYLEQQSKLKHWAAKHENDKQQSHDKYVAKVKEFVEVTKDEPYYCEDDHFQHWRNLHLFRDAAQQKKFKGYKAFKYRDGKDMSSLADLRERQERQLAQQHSEMLADRQKIAPEQKFRSLQSQGPYNEAGTSYRSIRRKPLQPPLRFRSVTDQEKFIENHLPETKFNHVVFRTMEQKRSKIGVPTKTPTAKEAAKKDNNHDMPRSHSLVDNTDKPVRHPQPERPRIIPTINQKSLNGQYSLYLPTPKKINSVIEMVNTEHLRPLKKYHFKGAIELSLGTTLNVKDDQQGVAKTAKQMLRDCQIDRDKHLQNIRNNINFEVYHKPPIL